MDLYLKIFEIAKAPYVGYDATNREVNQTVYPQMDGKRVFLNAVRGMVMSTNAALAKTGLAWSDIQWFVPHQANLRINEKVVEVAKIPPEKVLNTIEFYGNTTAATVPLTIDHWRQQGKVKRALAVLEKDAGSLGDLKTIGEITIGCALGYLDFRYANEPWRPGHPKLEAWYAKVAKLPPLAETVPVG